MNRAVIRLAPGVLAAPVLVAIAGFFDAGVVRAVLWTVALVVTLAAPFISGTEGWHVRPKHFAERHGLIIIIALGESIVALGLAASDEKHTAAVVTASVIGMVVVSAMWWLYFDVVAIAAERRLAQVTGATRNALARDSYSYLHALMILGIVFLALGLKKSVLDLGEPLKVIPSVALFGGVALYLVGHILFRLRNMGSLNTQRLLVAGLLVAAIPIGVAVPAYISLIMLLALLLGLIGYETVAYRDARHRLRYH
jgi:low temperature requirement protein LtrA